MTIVIRVIYLRFERFDSLDSRDRELMRSEHYECYRALLEKEYIRFSGNKEYASLDNEALYALIDSDSSLLRVTLSSDDPCSTLGKASSKEKGSITVKELIKGMMFFPLSSGTYEKV